MVLEVIDLLVQGETGRVVDGEELEADGLLSAICTPSFVSVTR